MDPERDAETQLMRGALFVVGAIVTGAGARWATEEGLTQALGWVALLVGLGCLVFGAVSLLRQWRGRRDSRD